MSDDAWWISEAEVAEAVDLPDAIAAVRDGFVREHVGAISPLSKTQVVWGAGHTLHALGAVDREAGLAATKSWAHTSGGATPLVVIWDETTGSLRAVIEAFALGQLRTAAVSGVATATMARPDADRLAVIGTGKQALAQVAAVVNVRAIDHVAVFSPTPEHRDDFAEVVRALVPHAAVRVARSVEDATHDAAVVTTVTRARTPLLHTHALRAATHINAVGAISAERAELAPEVIREAAVVCADSVHAARTLTAEMQDAAAIEPLSALVAAGTVPVAASTWTVFKAMGVGLADLAVGSLVLQRVLAAGGGRRLPQPKRSVPRLMKGLR